MGMAEVRSRTSSLFRVRYPIVSTTEERVSRAPSDGVISMQVIIAVDPTPGKHIHTTRERRTGSATQHENFERFAYITDDDYRRRRSNRLYRVRGLRHWPLQWKAQEVSTMHDIDEPPCRLQRKQ